MSIMPLVSHGCRFLLLVAGSLLALALPGQAMESGWWVLGGPEKENGDPVEILSNEGGDLSLNVLRRRGHVARKLEPVALPAVISLDWRTFYDETRTEAATELWGTGDFRISLVGLPPGSDLMGLDETNLGLWEGIQFRVFPHLDTSPIRRRTGPNNESHTATSIWVRYTNTDRLTGDDGAPHTGLQSDACQNRNKADGTHNCGWDRHTIIGGGFGLEDGEAAEMRIYLSAEEVYLEVNGRRFSVEPREIRFERLSAIVVGITNTSRGFERLEIRDLSYASAIPPPSVVSDLSFATGADGWIESCEISGFPLVPTTLQFSQDLVQWRDLVTRIPFQPGRLRFEVPEDARGEGFLRVYFASEAATAEAAPISSMASEDGRSGSSHAAFDRGEEPARGDP
jgi:hypothetical protein